MPATLKDITWDSRLQRYTVADKSLSPSDVRQLIDELVEASRVRMAEWATKMQAGKLSVPKWQGLMAKEVKNLHTSTAVIANGGREAMTSRTWGKLGSDLKFQYQRLRDFALEVPRKIDERGLVVIARSEMYAASAVGNFENNTLERNRDFGLTIARRVTKGGSDSCDDCLDQEDLGWQPIDEVKEIGDSQCQARCNCEIEYEEVKP
jgi:hypothetical protein